MHSQRHVDQDSPLDSLPLHHAFGHEPKEFISSPFAFTKPQSLKNSPQMSTAPHPMKFEELACNEHLHAQTSYLYGSQSGLVPPTASSASMFSAQASNYSLASAFPFAFGYNCPRWPTSVPPLLSPQTLSSSSSLDGARSFCPTVSPSTWSNSNGGLSSPASALDSTLHSSNEWALYYSGYANALYRSAAAAGNASGSSLAQLADRASASATIPNSSHASVSIPASYLSPHSLGGLQSSRDPIALFQPTPNVSAF